MAKLIVQILRLEPPFPDVDRPNRTLYIDATAADNLRITELVNTGQISNIHFVVGDKNILMDGTLHSLEFPFGNIIRLTDTALDFFKLRSGKRYWVEWIPNLRTLRILREVDGK